jgi:hypothetical protein
VGAAVQVSKAAAVPATSRAKTSEDFEEGDGFKLEPGLLPAVQETQSKKTSEVEKTTEVATEAGTAEVARQISDSRENPIVEVDEVTHQVHFDVKIDNEPAGCVVIALFGKEAPKAVEEPVQEEPAVEVPIFEGPKVKVKFELTKEVKAEPVAAEAVKEDRDVELSSVVPEPVTADHEELS